MERAIKKWWPVFVLPTLAAFIIGFIIPFIQGVYLAFCQFTTIRDATFTGINNFVRALSDTTFTHAFWYNCAFVFVSTLVINIGGLAVALILTRALRGTNAFRTVFFMPNLIGGIVLGYIWQILLNCVLALLEKPLLMLDATAGFWGLVILMAWQQIGYMMIIYIAGLQSIPETLLEAAEIDGANRWKQTWHITLPAIRATIIVLFILSIGDFLELGFEHMFLLLNSMNREVGEIFDTFVYTAGIQNGQLSFATAVGLFKGLVGLILVVGANSLAKRLGEEGVY